MLKIIAITYLILFSVFVIAQNKNTLIKPVKLSDKEIEVVLYEIRNLDKQYDPKVHLVWTTTSPGYHSDFYVKTQVHGTLPSLKYALALLDSQKPKNRERAFKILKAVLAIQDQNPQSKTCGIWPYHIEEPSASKKSPVDRNWADFCAVPIISIINNHYNQLPDDLKEKIKNALLLANQAIRKRDVRPDYTNISLMGLYVCYMTADMYNNADLMVYARKRLKTFYECTLLNKGFIEYNSPPYFKLALDEVLRLKSYVINPEDHAMLDSIYNIGWSVVARHYHQPSAQWAGPHGRCYSVLLGPSTYSWFFNASGGIIKPVTPSNYSKDQDPVLKHQIPDYLMHYFTIPIYPRIEIDTFIHGQQKIELNPLVSYQESDHGVFIITKEVIGKSYLTKDYVLSSANRSCLWNQRRPLIAFWGTEEKPVSMQVRFLHDMYDYSSANIFCSQDSTNVLGAINCTTNGGDRHVSIDVIKNGAIKATDLRLRFEFGGDIGSVKFLTPNEKTRIVKGTSGNINFRIEIPYVNFSNYKGSLLTGGDDKTKWIDLVLYSGSEREFDFNKIQKAVLGFLVSINTGKSIPNQMVKISDSENYLNLSWENLRVKALIKSYAERATLVLK